MAHRARIGLLGARRPPLFHTRRPAKPARRSSAVMTGSCCHRRDPARQRVPGGGPCSVPGGRAAPESGTAKPHHSCRVHLPRPRVCGCSLARPSTPARRDWTRMRPWPSRAAGWSPRHAQTDRGASPLKKGKEIPRKPAWSMPAGQGATRPPGTPGFRPRQTRPPEWTALSSSVPTPGILDGRRDGEHARMTTAQGHSWRSRFTLMTKPRVERSDQRSSTSVSRSSVYTMKSSLPGAHSQRSRTLALKVSRPALY